MRSVTSIFLAQYPITNARKVCTRSFCHSFQQNLDIFLSLLYYYFYLLHFSTNQTLISILVVNKQPDTFLHINKLASLHFFNVLFFHNICYNFSFFLVAKDFIHNCEMRIEEKKKTNKMNTICFAVYYFLWC